MRSRRTSGGSRRGRAGGAPTASCTAATDAPAQCGACSPEGASCGVLCPRPCDFSRVTRPPGCWPRPTCRACAAAGPSRSRSAGSRPAASDRRLRSVMSRRRRTRPDEGVPGSALPHRPGRPRQLSALRIDRDRSIRGRRRSRRSSRPGDRRTRKTSPASRSTARTGSRPNRTTTGCRRHRRR